jgi:hypothetical protein
MSSNFREKENRKEEFEAKKIQDGIARRPSNPILGLLGVTGALSI